MVFSYIYVSLHYKSDCYYLVIDKTLDKPLRIYKDELQRVLDLNLFTYRDALIYLRKHLVDYIKDVDKWIIQTEIRSEKNSTKKKIIDDALSTLYAIEDHE